NSTSFGDPAMLFRSGLKYDPALLYASNLDPGIRPSPGQIDNPSGWIDPNGGRPSRSLQWSVGLQREIGRNLVVEASYVGNVGARWAPLGNVWYDSLQVKATKRYSYGLDFALAFTWQKELASGAEDQGGGTAIGVTTINDVFNRANQKYISPSSQPLVTVI